MVLVVVGIIFIVAYSVSTVPTEEEIEKKFWDIWGGIQHHLHISEEGNTTMSDNVTQVATTAGMGHRSLTRHWGQAPKYLEQRKQACLFCKHTIKVRVSCFQWCPRISAFSVTHTNEVL